MADQHRITHIACKGEAVPHESPYLQPRYAGVWWYCLRCLTTFSTAPKA